MSGETRVPGRTRGRNGLLLGAGAMVLGTTAAWLWNIRNQLELEERTRARLAKRPPSAFAPNASAIRIGK